MHDSVHRHEERIQGSELARYRRRDMTPQGVQSGNPIGYEHGDANIKAVITFVVVSGASVAILLLMAVGAFSYFEARETRVKDRVASSVYAVKPVPPSPRMLPSPLEGANELPWDAMNKQRAEQEGQANAQGQYARPGSIPIAEAMRREARANGDKVGQGLPAYSTLTKNSPLYPPNYRWDRADEKMNVDASGGRTLEEPVPQMRPKIFVQKAGTFKAPNTFNQKANNTRNSGRQTNPETPKRNPQ